jgi:hypothetical protein
MAGKGERVEGGVEGFFGAVGDLPYNHAGG